MPLVTLVSLMVAATATRVSAAMPAGGADFHQVLLAFLLLLAIIIWNVLLNRRLRVQARHLRAEIERRRQQAEELRLSQERLQLAIRAGNIGIWDWDVADNTLTWDDSMYRLYAIDRERFTGDYDAWRQTLHPQDASHVEAEVRAALAGERAYAPEFRVILADGSVHVIQAAAQIFRDRDGTPRRMIGTNLDITERKRFEREMMDRNAELERFTYTVSHDLKSPLITIKGFAGALARDLERGNHERMAADIRRISTAADTMKDLLRDLLQLARIGRVVSPAEEVSMDGLVREVLAQLAGPISESGVEVVVQPDLPAIRCDRLRLSEVVQNLLENAIKYRGDAAAPRIEIGCRRMDGKHIFFVRDNGMGIEQQYHDIIFGLFNKLDANSEGTGIGLALVKRIVEVHGGSCWVESAGAGQGSTFFFSLDHRQAGG